MTHPTFLAIDLGAESGRAILGTLADNLLSLDEVHRFPNQPVEAAGTLYWDILSLYAQVLEGLRLTAERYGGEVESVGIDSWSVDFGLLAADGSLLGNPVHYRDHRTEGMLEAAGQAITPARLFELTGLTPAHFHTVFQLYALRLGQSRLLQIAGGFLMMPDLLGYFLTGRRLCERTNACHTQLFDARTREWCPEIFGALDLPLEIMPPLVDPGTPLGPLQESVQTATGMGPVQVIDPCTHDTASAVVAVPMESTGDAFLSSGTWSILGALTAEPVLTPEAHAARFMNELSLGPFLCRNLMGLWLLQECRRSWQRGGRHYSYEDLESRAERAPAGGPVVFPDHPSFLAPADMPVAIREFCTATGQTPPDSIDTLARCVLDSLALSYRYTLEQLTPLLGHRFIALRIVGGGSQNTLLCRLAADATGLFTTAGPVEATVAGNILVQAMAKGYLGTVDDIREVVRHSFMPEAYEPRPNLALEDQYEQYLVLMGG
jgi:rhamnulokinase